MSHRLTFVPLSIKLIGERPFQCSKCEKHFKTVGALELHERRHAGIKPYICTYCGKSFVESSNLKVHVRSHTNEKPHICVSSVSFVLNMKQENI